MSTDNRGAFRFGSFLAIASVASLVAATGCGLLKKKEEDAGADDAAVAVADDASAAVDAAPAAPVAVNVADVARFPDEVPVANVAAVILRPTNVRDIPAVGKVSATLAKGGTVTQLASRGTAFLIVFDNPANQQRVMGWVPQESFTAPPAVDAGVKQIACVAPDIAVHLDSDQCARPCKVDSECVSGQACRQVGAVKIVGGKLAEATNICIVSNVAPVATAPTASTAPATPTAPGVIPDVAPAVGGKCPVGATFAAKDGQCHRSCGLIVKCDNGFKCTKCGAGSSMCVANTAVVSFCR